MNAIPPPVKPVLEPLEPTDELNVPDHACVWGPRNENADCIGGWHDIAECVNCGASAPHCAYEKPLDEQVTTNCLRRQAERRNRERRVRYNEAMRDYDAQVRYYISITGGTP